MEQALVFSLGSEHCALQVTHIQEVVESPPFYYIPLAPAVVPGAINFHGNILPVIDLPVHFGISGTRRDRRIIVMAAALCKLALTVTNVRRIVLLDPDELTAASSEGPLADLSRAAFTVDGTIINLLDAPKLVAGLEKIGLSTGGDHGG